MLNTEQRATLLQVARESIEAAMRRRTYTPQSNDPGLLEPHAAFVTIRKLGELRGCIGIVEPSQPLVQAVAAMAREAALNDFRFEPVAPEEVPDLDLEISVLTLPCRVADISEIEVGTHGLIVEQGPCRGLLLPQVPVEWGWDREQFLAHTCVKAGLPRDAWRKGAKLFCFSAEVFGEREDDRTAGTAD
jgi:AmmeMemoRadiSam system protein A